MALIKLNNQSLSAVTSAGLPSGTVLNVVQQENTIGLIGTALTTFQATGHIISITPSSSSSKFLISLTGGQITYSAGDTLRTRLYRKIGTGSYSDLTGDFERVSQSSTYNFGHAFSYLDSPSTTSTVYYQPYFRSQNGNTMYYDYTDVDTNAMLTIMEIAG